MRTPDTETMTAPLPPLKDEVCPCCQGSGMVMAPSFSEAGIEIERWCRVCRGKGKLPRTWNDEEVQAYAKLAVREALLGLIRKSISHNWVEPSEDGNIVTIPESALRAMIEEYK